MGNGTTLTDQDAELMADHIVDKLIDRVTDPETVRAITAVWGTEADKLIGRGFRKLAWTFLVAALLVASVKFPNVWSAFVNK